MPTDNLNSDLNNYMSLESNTASCLLMPTDNLNSNPNNYMSLSCSLTPTDNLNSDLNNSMSLESNTSSHLPVWVLPDTLNVDHLIPSDGNS